MHVPGKAAGEEERRSRRRRREKMARDAEIKLDEMRRGPDPHVFYSPKVLMGLLAVLVVLGGLVVSSVSRRPAAVAPELPHRKALRELDTLATALGRYRFHVGRYPGEETGLRALIDNPGATGWMGPYINALRRDPWGTPYQYRQETNGVIGLFTCGPDRQPGTPDDLRPDPAAFDPGTSWTSGWVRASERLPGVRIIRKKAEHDEQRTD